MASIKRVISQKLMTPTQERKKKRQAFDPMRPTLPLIVESACEFIEQNAMDIVGIFRLSGDFQTINSLLKGFEKGTILKFNETENPHNVSGVIKLWLCELDESLLTNRLHSVFLAIFSTEKARIEMIREMKEAINQLPIGNRIIFQYILSLLQKVHLNSEKNNMSAKNIAIVFAPALLRSTTRDLQVMLAESNASILVIEFCIVNYHSIFETLDRTKSETFQNNLKFRVKSFLSMKRKGGSPYRNSSFTHADTDEIPDFDDDFSPTLPRRPTHRSVVNGEIFEVEPITPPPKRHNSSPIVMKKQKRNSIGSLSLLNNSPSPRRLKTSTSSSSASILHNNLLKDNCNANGEEMASPKLHISLHNSLNISLGGNPSSPRSPRSPNSPRSPHSPRSSIPRIIRNIHHHGTNKDAVPALDINHMNNNNTHNNNNLNINNNNSNNQNNQPLSPRKVSIRVGEDDLVKLRSELGTHRNPLPPTDPPVPDHPPSPLPKSPLSDRRNDLINGDHQANSQSNIGKEDSKIIKLNINNNKDVRLRHSFTSLPPPKAPSPRSPPSDLPQPHFTVNTNTTLTQNNTSTPEAPSTSTPSIDHSPAINNNDNDDNDVDLMNDKLLDKENNQLIVNNNNDIDNNNKKNGNNSKEDESPMRKVNIAQQIKSTIQQFNSLSLKDEHNADDDEEDDEYDTEGDYDDDEDDENADVTHVNAPANDKTLKNISAEEDRYMSDMIDLLCGDDDDLSYQPPHNVINSNSNNNIAINNNNIASNNNNINSSNNNNNIEEKSNTKFDKAKDDYYSDMINFLCDDDDIPPQSNTTPNNNNNTPNTPSTNTTSSNTTSSSSSIQNENEEDDLCEGYDIVEDIYDEEEEEDDEEVKEGIVIYSDGTKYIGELKNNQWHGRGRCIFADGNIYDGEVKCDMFHGVGTMIYFNGDKYIGEWANDLKEGYGCYTSVSGDIYNGHFEADQRHGEGTYFMSDGSIYIGEFKHGRPSGSGEWKFENGDVYKGSFLDEEFHGYGVFTAVSGSRYEGQFQHGLKSGKGRLLFPNGDLYEGEFLDDLPHGNGWLKIQQSNTILSGSFLNGRFVQ